MDRSVDQVRADYDAVPYDSHPFPQTAPGHMAAVAHLFGLSTPKVSTARVLEIGCSAGGNLIPFAAHHPLARVTGIDLSQVQIEKGRQHVKALGLHNVELRRADIANMDLSTLGQFDFIICHGVYSWVPETVQDGILSAFQQLLSDDGIAHVSYNVYPGWKAKEIVRDAMLLRGGDQATPAEKLSYARGMIDFMEQVAPEDSVIGKALADFRSQSINFKDYYVLHEYLESFNAPCYFLKMVSKANDKHLSYLADVEPRSMFAVNYGSKIAEPLLKECGHSQTLVEQYLDFFNNRTFRQSLFVRSGRAQQIRYQLDRDRQRDFHFAAWLPRHDNAAGLDESEQTYGDQTTSIVTSEPVVKAALDTLNFRWPATISRPELDGSVAAAMAAAGFALPDNHNARVDDLLEHLIMIGQIRFRLEPVRLQAISTTLRLEDAARVMPELGRPEEAYTFNAWHEELQLSPVDRFLVPLLDGTHSRDDLVDAIVVLARQDVIRYERDGRRITDEAELRNAVAEEVDGLPHRLVAMKLLCAQ